MGSWGVFQGQDGGRALQRQSEAKDGAPTVTVLHPDAAAVDLDDGAADGEAQTSPAALSFAWQPVELLEDPLRELRGDTRAPVRDSEDEVAPLPARRDREGG